MAYCPNTSLKEWKDLVSAQGENLSYFLWDKYKGNVPSMFYLQSFEAPQTITIDPSIFGATSSEERSNIQSIEELFQSDPELANIGTAQQYSDYLKTIFPNSTDQSIFYHGLPNIEDKEDFFRDSDETGIGRENEANIRLWNFFFKTRERAADYGDQQYNVILDFSSTFDSNEVRYKASPTFLTGDSAIVLNQGSDEYVVKNKKQIHILGSRKDIQGFQKFVNSNKAFRTSAQVSSTQRVNVDKAKSWVAQRFGENALSIYETAEKIGNEEVHGYVENGLMYMWSAAEIGTEFHEGYHLVFRGMLSEEQRQGLYAEAEQNFGKPTASEIAAIKNQFPDISDQEAYNLVLEEKMAEEFREYMLAEGEVKSLPAKISKFFRDLWNFLKAIMTDGLSLQQTYSLISSNKMNSTLFGRGVFRNSEKFKGNNRANLARPGFGPEAIQDGVDILYTKFLNYKKKYKNPENPFDINRVLGQNENKGSLVNGLIVQIYENEDGTPLTNNKEGAIEILEAELAYYADNTQENKIAFLDALDKHKARVGMTSDPRKRTLYKNMYTTWWDKAEKKTGNIVEEGWRTALTKKLREAGLYADGKLKKDSDESDEDMIDDPEAEAMNEEFAAINEAVNKIFGQSNMEINPSKRLTGKVKELLASILSEKENSFGEFVMMDREVVFKELLTIFSGKQTYAQMLAAINQAVKTKPNFAPVQQFLAELTAPQKAMIFSAFALNNSEFILLRQVIEQDEDGNNTSNYTQVFNPNRKDIPTAIAERWKNTLVSETEGQSLYFSQTLIKGEGAEQTQEQVITVDKVRFLKAVEAYREVERLFTKNAAGKLNIPVGRVNGEINPIIESLGKTMFELGLYVGSDTNIGDTITNLQTLADVGLAGVSGTNTIIKVSDQVRAFIKKIGTFNNVKGSDLGEFESIKAVGATDYLSAEKSKAIEFAENFKDLVKTAGISFVNSKGKAIYATNTETHMTQIVNTLKGGNAEAKALYEMYMKDPFNNGGGNPAYASILFKHLQNPEFLKDWGVFDFDAAKGASDYDDALAYEDLSVADNMVVRLNAFINGRADSPLTYSGIPTQADREKYTFMSAPRLSQNHYKMQFASYNDLLKAQIVQDLLRVAAAKQAVENARLSKDYSNLIEGYHTEAGNPTATLSNVNGLISEREYLGNAFKQEFFQLTGMLEGIQIVTDATLQTTNAKQNGKLQLSDVIQDYVSGKASISDKAIVDAKLNEMVSKLNTYFTQQASKVKSILASAEKISLENPLYGEVGVSGIPGNSTFDQTLKGFVIEQAIMKNEMVKLFRGNRAMTKNLEDFYKRMGHLTTPGTKMAMKGQVGTASWLNGDQRYGMMEQFNEIVMRDIRMDLTPEQTDEAKATVENIKLGLVKSGIPLAEAEVIANNYLPGQYDSTDAQAYISLEMHRSIMQGLGKWSKEDEKAYEAYQTTGELVYQPGFVPEGMEAGDAVPLLPHKGYFESLAYDESLNVVYPDSQKNSYMVLIQNYTKTSPHLEDLRQRMEGKGIYAGQEPIHVVNFVSGKKLAKRGVYKHNGVIGSLGDIVVNKYDSAKLRFPQFIPSPKENPKNALNRQIKKNMVANVEDDTTYFISPGIQDIAIEGKDLKALYHAAIEEKLNRDMEKVKSELKISDLEKAIGTNDLTQINDAKLEVLKAVREIILKQAVEKELHSNYEKALNIQFDSDGSPQFAVPLDLPLYNKKYESIIMSLVNNNVFKQKVKGFEGVQIAQLGGSQADGSGALQFIQISEDGKRVIHAEIKIREDVARKFGIKPGQSLDSIPEDIRRVIGYRIPNADKGATVILKIVEILPANYGKAVVVPGQLTKLMGSDFDVDKLNLLFPEVDVEEKTGKITKTQVPYSEIIASKSVKNLSTKQLHNIILDTFEAVYSNPAHFKEVFTPLDEKTLKGIRDDIRAAVPALAEQTDWNDVNTELLTALRNTLGNKLRGIYANALAARNVLQHGTVNLEKASAIVIDEQEYTQYVTDVFLDINDPSKGTIPSDKALALWLSAAVDAAKTPLQYELNDTVLTSRVRILFAAYYPEYSSKTCSYFLNQPLVRQFTEYFENTHSGDLRKLTDAYKVFVSSQRFTTNEEANYANYKDFPGTQPMKSSEIFNLNTEARDRAEQAKMLGNFMKFYTAGRMLMKLNKRVTPDSMDGMGRIGSVQAYQDRANVFDIDEDGSKQVFFRGPDANKNVVDQFIGEDSVFGLERGYENLLDKTLNFSSVLFGTRMSPSFLNFKEALKKHSKIPGGEFNAEMHQLIDYNLMFMMLMKPGSPMASLGDMENLYRDPNDNIYTRLQSLKTEFPGLNENKFVANIEKDYIIQPNKKGKASDKFGKNYYGIKFDNTFSYSVPEKEGFTQGLYDMLFNPEFFVPDGNQKDANRIKAFAIKLAMHSFFANGFRQGASSYADIVPIEFFTIKHKDGNSIVDFFRQEAKKAVTGDYFTHEDLLQYMALFGRMRAGGSNLLTRVKGEHLDARFASTDPKAPREITFSNTSAPFIVVRNQKNGLSAVFMRLNQSESKGGGYVYRIMEGTLATKGMTKLAGAGFMTYQDQMSNTRIAEHVDANMLEYTIDRKKQLPESGAMACII